MHTKVLTLIWVQLCTVINAQSVNSISRSFAGDVRYDLMFDSDTKRFFCRVPLCAGTLREHSQGVKDPRRDGNIFSFGGTDSGLWLSFNLIDWDQRIRNVIKEGGTNVE